MGVESKGEGLFLRKWELWFL